MRGAAFSGFFEHLLGVIESRDGRGGPTLRQNGGAVSGAATEVDDVFGITRVDLGGEVQRRARAFGLEQEILVGLPDGHVNFYYVGFGWGRGATVGLASYLRRSARRE